MTIVGDTRYISDPEFTRKVQQAVNLLKTRGGVAYGNLIGCVERIRAYDRSGTDVYASPITINIAEETFKASFTWLASVLAHESCHAALFLAGRPHTGRESEEECNAYQLMILRQIGGPQGEITHLLNQMKGDHSDLNKDGVYDWQDYQLRKY